METNKYRYCFIDSSYLIRRNGWAVSRGKKPGEYNAMDIVRMCIQSINKMARDYGVTADKYILVFDTWSKEYQGYYRSYLVKDFVTYKGSRQDFPTVQGLLELKEKPGITGQELSEYADKLYENQQRVEAKKVLKNLGGIGIPSLSVESFEYDDLIYMASILMVNEDKPSVMVTKDSDLQYCTTPALDYFSIPTSGSEPKFITFQEMWNTVPVELQGLLSGASLGNFGSALYFYKALLDSMGDGHNDLLKTRKIRHDANKAIYRILSAQDYQDIENPELFKKQLETFKVFDYPKATDAYQAICRIPGMGHYASIADFRDFCNKTGLKDISDSYYQGFLERLDQKLFSE